MKRPLGLAALTVLELPHHEQVSVAAQAGYSHVGLRLVPVAGQPEVHQQRVEPRAFARHHDASLVHRLRGVDGSAVGREP